MMMTPIAMRTGGEEQEKSSIPNKTTGSPASLYIHYPFCRRKCPYCHFFVLSHRVEQEKRWKDAILREWQQRKIFYSQRPLLSCYFGGGTPYLLDIRYFEEILTTILTTTARVMDDIEITVEVNPEDVSLEKMRALQKLGVNRVSIGVQSFDPHLLKKLGRTHNSLQAIYAVEMASTAGIPNISIDLMYDIPEQTLSSFQKTLAEAYALPVTHISLYNLTIEPYTAFYRNKETLTKERPSDMVSIAMLEAAISLFDQGHWERYEISAFAKKGNRSQHNLGYWQGREFIGLGPSAFSYINGCRSQNLCNFPLYEKRLEKHLLPVGFTETLPFPSNMREAIAIGLRVKEGIQLEEIEKKWNLPIPVDTRNILDRLVTEGFLMRYRKRYYLTNHGKNFYDTVAVEII